MAMCTGYGDLSSVLPPQLYCINCKNNCKLYKNCIQYLTLYIMQSFVVPYSSILLDHTQQNIP